MGIDDAIFKLSKVQFKGLQPSMQIIVMSQSPRPMDRDQGRSMYEADKKVMASVDKMLGLLSSTQGSQLPSETTSSASGKIKISALTQRPTTAGAAKLTQVNIIKELKFSGF